MTLRDALLEASTSIARRDAETLLAHILYRDRAWLLAHADDDADELSDADHTLLRALTTRRAAHEPLQYLTGTQEFFGLALHVTPAVLIPRPETEHLVEAVLAWARTQSESNPPDAASSRPLQIADVGTGSGAIALALAANLPHADITAIDLSPAALAVARHNADRLGLASRIHFLEADLLQPFTGNTHDSASLDVRAPQRTCSLGWDAVVSNPPYVAQADAPTLAPEVRGHEPHLALFAGHDGLAVYRHLIPQAFNALRPGGLLALEIGFGQRDPLAHLLAHPDHPWHNVRFIDDYASIPRVVLATRP
jgi:release factor glutamine methyltransferase